jgi:hypothetical protein
MKLLIFQNLNNESNNSDNLQIISYEQYMHDNHLYNLRYVDQIHGTRLKYQIGLTFH